MPNQPKVTRKLRAILSADVKGYSLLMADDEAFTIKTLKEYRSIMSMLIQQHNGRVVDAPGDNLLADFSSVVDAVECAVEIQKQLETENDQLEDDKRLQYRIGVNIGDVVQDGDRIYGNGVNVAARIEGLADPGGVCISRNAYDHISDKLNFGYEYLGEHSVKNIKKPVRVYKLLMADEDAGKLIGDVSRRVTRNWLYATAVLALIVIASVVWQVYQKMTEPEFEPASVENMAYQLPNKPSIAVLPFDNMSGDPKQEYFSDGMTEDIITALSKIDDLFVIARNSTFTYKGKPVMIKQVAEELGVQYVLEGSVRKSEDRIRVNAQLIDAIEGNHLWAERYDRDLKDIFTLQDEITMKIVTALRIELTEGEQARMWGERSPNLDVQLKVMEGLSLWRKGTKEGLIRFGQIGKEIVGMAPESPTGYIALAVYNWTLAMHGKSPEESIAKAFENAQKAVSLGESFAMPHAILGNVYLLKRDYEKAIKLGKRAVELEPNGADVHVTLGNTLGYAGRIDEAIGHLKQGIRLNPFPPSWYFLHLGRCYRQNGQYDNALSAYEKAVQRSPEYIHNHISLASVYVLLGRQDKAAAAAQKVLEIDPHFTIKMASKAWPYKNPTDLKIYIETLRKAGLPYEPSLPVPDKPSIAVLPFDNLSDDPEQGYLADGLTDELIGDLAKIKDVLVISRNSVFTYKGKDIKIPEVAKELNVRYVLEGSVQRSGNKIRIRAQLIDGETDHHVWAESYDGVMDDIFELEDKITGKIVSALAVKLSPGEQKRISSRGTSNHLAYEAFLNGREHYYKFTPDDFIKAVFYFEQAIKIDPNYSRAYAVLGMTYNLAWEFGFTEFFDKFKMRGDSARLKAIHYLKFAMRNPTFEAYSFVTEVERDLRHFDNMIDYAEKAVSIAPNAADANLLLGRMFLWSSQSEKAIEYCNRAILLDPSSIDTFAEATLTIGNAHFQLGLYEQAVEFIEKALEIKPEMRKFYSDDLAACYAHLNRVNEAKNALEYWLKYFPSGTYPSLQNIYGWYAITNDEVFDRFAEGLVKAGLPGDPSDYVKLVEENKLTAEEVKELTLGHTITSFYYGEDWLEIDKEGNFNYKWVSTNREKEFLDKGKSWIEGDMVCVQFEKINSGFTNCADYYRNPKGNAEAKNEYLRLDYRGLYFFSIVD